MWSDRGVEEIVMNQELRDAFDDIKQDMKDAHQETRSKISDFGTSLNRHMLEDALTARALHEHLEAEKATKKWRIALWTGLFIAFVAAMAERWVTHFMKG